MAPLGSYFLDDFLVTWYIIGLLVAPLYMVISSFDDYQDMFDYRQLALHEIFFFAAIWPAVVIQMFYCWVNIRRDAERRQFNHIVTPYNRLPVKRGGKYFLE